MAFQRSCTTKSARQENIRKNLAIERMITEGCEILLDTSQTFVRQGAWPQEPSVPGCHQSLCPLLVTLSPLGRWWPQWLFWEDSVCRPCAHLGAVGRGGQRLSVAEGLTANSGTLRGVMHLEVTSLWSHVLWQLGFRVGAQRWPLFRVGPFD